MNFNLKLRSGIWYARVRKGQKDIQRSTGTGNKRLAEKIAQEWADRAPNSEQSLGVYLAPFYTDACPHVMRVHEDGGPYSEKVRKSNRVLLEKHVIPDPICALSLFEIRRGDILAFRSRLVQKLGKCRTVNVIMRTLTVALHEALFQEVIDRDPCAKVGAIKYEKKKREALTPAAVRIILNPRKWDDPLLWRASACAALTGLRAGEVRGLKWGDLDVKRQRLAVDRQLEQTSSEETLPKWGKTRTAIYPLVLQRILEPYRDDDDDLVFQVSGGPMGYARWAREFKKVSKAAGAPEATLHCLRHTLNTLLRGAGLPDDPLRGAFGWSEERVQEGYTHRENYNLLPIAQAVTDLFGGKNGKRKRPK